jgi:hypothetical protein
MGTEKKDEPFRSWNDRMSGRTVPKNSTKKNYCPFYLIVAVSLCVVGIVAWLFVSPSEIQEPETTSKAEKKKAVKPTRVKPVKVEPEKPKEEVVMKRDRKGNLRPWKRPETYRDEKGVLRYKAGGARAPEKDEFKNAVKINTPSNIPRFKHQVEHEIATLLTIEPGGALFGSVRYDKRFEQDFVNSLMEPVKIEEDDSEEDKQLKKDVEATKRELAKRIKSGEDLATILTETREEVRRLAAIKQDIMTIAREELSKAELSDSDVKDYYEAVNKLLEQKGIAPINANSLMKRRAIRQAKMANQINQQ